MITGMRPWMGATTALAGVVMSAQDSMDVSPPAQRSQTPAKANVPPSLRRTSHGSRRPPTRFHS